jgi:hypothetical protein
VKTTKPRRQSQKVAREDFARNLTAELKKLDALITRAKKHVKAGNLRKLDAAEVLKMRNRAARRWNRFRNAILQPLNEDLRRPSRRAILEGRKSKQ